MCSQAKCIKDWDHRYAHKVYGHENGAKGDIPENLLGPVRVNFIKTGSYVVNNGSEKDSRGVLINLVIRS